jgi:hypothetical protein
MVISHCPTDGIKVNEPLVTMAKAISTQIGAFGMVLGASWLAMTACSNSNSTQCSSRADCDALGFVGYECTAEGLCKLPQFVTPAPEDGGSSSVCNTDEECVAANGGRAAICPQPGAGTCLPLANDYCSVVGDYKNKNAILVGDTRSNLSPNSSYSFFSLFNSYQVELAWSQFNTALPGGGVPSTNEAVRRPIVRVICEDKGDPELTAAGAAHLVSVVHAPLINASSAESVYAIQNEAAKHPDHAPLIWAGLVASNMRRALSGTGDIANLFQSVMGYDEIAPGFAGLISRAETKIRGAADFNGEDLRVAVVVNTNPQVRAAADAIMDVLTINGKSAVQQPDLVKRFDYVQDDPSQLVAQTTPFKPHVVMMVSSVEASRLIIPRLEAAWSNEWRPEYVALGLQANAALLDTIGGNDELRRRVVGIFSTAGVKDPVRFNQYRSEYVATYPGTPPAVTATGYDGVFLLGHTLATASSKSTRSITEQPTAAELRQALAWVSNQTSSASFFTGPGDVNAAIAAAQTGPIRLRGITLSFNFDPTSGSSLDYSAVWCVSPASAGYTINFATGQVYDAKANSFLGKYNCP